MKPEDKKYILENINKKSIKEISQELNIKERKIRKFLEKEKRAGKEKPEVRAPIKKKTILVSVALIIILGFAVYANSFNGKFSWDDEALVKDNMYIRSWSKIKNIFTENIGAGAGERYNFYRPIQMITYMIDYSLWKLDVRGYHLTNVLFHVLAALCIYWLVNICYDDRLLSLFTAALFVVHPIHTEAVDYISGRADSLALLFMLLCLIFYIKSLHWNKLSIYILMFVTYIFALLSKENSLIFPALLLLYHYSFKKKIKSRQFLPILSIALIYITLRFTTLKFLLSGFSCPTTLFQRIPGFFVAITDYIKLLFLPFNLHMEYGNETFSLADPRVIPGIFILLALLIYAIRKRNANSLIFFSIGWFFITLLPVSNLYPVNAYMAEHWLYVPSVGFFLILANGLKAIQKSRAGLNLSYFFVIILLVFYSSLTVRQNSYWREPLTLYERTLRYTPNSIRVLNNLSAEYHRIGRYDEAIALYKKVIDTNPGYSKLYKAYNNLGVAYHDIGKLDEALAVYKKAVALKPDYADMHYNIGLVYRDMGRHEEAIASYKRAIGTNPASADADMYNVLGISYSELARTKEAIASFKRAIEIDPTYKDPYSNLGRLYMSLGRKEEAQALFKKAESLKSLYE